MRVRTWKSSVLPAARRWESETGRKWIVPVVYRIPVSVWLWGYAAGKGVPYQRAISKYTPTWPRSFTPSNQEMRSLVAKMKLIANRDMLKDKRVLFCDDSIVRGDATARQYENLIRLWSQRGAHAYRLPSVDLRLPVYQFHFVEKRYGVDYASADQGVRGDENKNLEKYAQTGSPEYQRMVDTIAERLNLSSLKFNTLEDLYRSHRLCLNVRCVRIVSTGAAALPWKRIIRMNSACPPGTTDERGTVRRAVWSAFYIILTTALYFLLLFVVSRKAGGAGDNDTFFRGNRRSPWWAVAFGMIGASLSGVSFVSVPGMVRDVDMTYMQMCVGFFFGYLVVAFVLLPLYYKLNLTSIYTYLDVRFGKTAYRTGAFFLVV